MTYSRLSTTAVIDGKRYSTATAEQVASWSNSFGYTDFKWCAESLYRTAKGNYFLLGSGGALSPYAKSVAKGVVGSEDNIVPLSRSAARDWLARHSFTDELEAHFADETEVA